MARLAPLLASLCAAAALPAQTTPAATPAAPTVPVRARAAVVTMLAYGATGDAFSTATGFIAGDGRVVSTLRPLRGAMRVELYGASGDLMGTATALELADTRKDLAVFARIPGTTARLLPARRQAAFGQKVVVLGPRGGAGDGLADATIAAVEESERGRVMRLNAQIGTGFIGGPIVTARGELLGVVVGALSGRDEAALAVDVADLRELLARPAARLAFPTRDGTVAPIVADTRPAGPQPPAARPPAREPSVIERFGALVATDSVKDFTVELFGCAAIETRQKFYCHLRITNRGRAATLAIAGADLTNGERRRMATAEHALVGDSTVRIAGRGTKAAVGLREQEFRRVALEFPLPRPGDPAPARLMVDIDGEKALWFAPLTFSRAP